MEIPRTPYPQQSTIEGVGYVVAWYQSEFFDTEPALGQRPDISEEKFFNMLGRLFNKIFLCEIGEKLVKIPKIPSEFNSNLHK
jgi:hypothetical protein